MERDHYLVDGVGNSDMKTQVKNALENMDGVNNVCVDMARCSIEVIYSNPATSSQIKKCIEKTGNKIIE